MSKVVIHTEIDTKSLLVGLTHLKISELEDFAKELNDFIKRKKSDDKAFRDEQLLLKINQTVLSQDERKRYLELIQKLEQGTISERERQICLGLAEKDEQLRNERVALMIQLAQLRNVSFNHLMMDLGLQPMQDV